MLNSTITKQRQRASEYGSALVYILIAIALLAALTVSFMEPSSQQTSSQNTFKTVSALRGQVDTIRSAIQECILLHPQGDTTITETGYNIPFPLNPDSLHLPAAGFRAANRNAENLRCPGDNEGAPSEHARIFGGRTGKFLAPPPDLFETWQYYNGPDGVFYWTGSSNSDAFIQTALARLDERFSDCEADVIDASAATRSLDGASTINCPTGNTCFRVWIVTDNETAIDLATSTYPDETACNTP